MKQTNIKSVKSIGKGIKKTIPGPDCSLRLSRPCCRPPSAAPSRSQLPWRRWTTTGRRLLPSRACRRWPVRHWPVSPCSPPRPPVCPPFSRPSYRRFPSPFPSTARTLTFPSSCGQMDKWRFGLRWAGDGGEWPQPLVPHLPFAAMGRRDGGCGALAIGHVHYRAHAVVHVRDDGNILRVFALCWENGLKK